MMENINQMEQKSKKLSQSKPGLNSNDKTSKELQQRCLGKESRSYLLLFMAIFC